MVTHALLKESDIPLVTDAPPQNQLLRRRILCWDEFGKNAGLVVKLAYMQIEHYTSTILKLMVKVIAYTPTLNLKRWAMNKVLISEIMVVLLKDLICRFHHRN